MSGARLVLLCVCAIALTELRRRRFAIGCARPLLEASPQVPGGSYQRTYDNDGARGGSDPATVSAFRLDHYLVTVGRFRTFVAASVADGRPRRVGQARPPERAAAVWRTAAARGFEPGWSAADNIRLPTTAAAWPASLGCEPSFQTWTDARARTSAADQLHRLVDAYAFCIWDGGFLPSEAEWEYAAAGRRRAARLSLGRHRSREQRLCDLGLQLPARLDVVHRHRQHRAGRDGPAGAGRWGQLDLAGELAEWTLDWYAPYATPCVDCATLTDFSYKVLRGGSFGTDTDDIFAFARDGDVPATRNAFDGVRCARSP